MTDLVVISLESWDGVWRRNQHLIWRTAAGRPGLCVCFSWNRPPIPRTNSARAGGRGSVVGPMIGTCATDCGRCGRSNCCRVGSTRARTRASLRQVVRAAAGLGMNGADALGQRSRRRRDRPPHGLAHAVRHDRRLAGRGPPGGRAARVCRAGGRTCSITPSRWSPALPSCSDASPRSDRRRGIRRPHPQRGRRRRRTGVPARGRPTCRRADSPCTSGTLHADRLDVALLRADRARARRRRGPLVLVGPNASAARPQRALRDAGVVAARTARRTTR